MRDGVLRWGKGESCGAEDMGGGGGGSQAAEEGVVPGGLVQSARGRGGGHRKVPKGTLGQAEACKDTDTDETEDALPLRTLLSQ